MIYEQANGLKGCVSDDGVPLFGASPIKYCHYLSFVLNHFTSEPLATVHIVLGDLYLFYNAELFQCLGDLYLNTG